MFGFGRGIDTNTPGFIPDSLDPLTKTKKYVELLLPEGKERVLMGEPGMINNGFMSSLMDFGMRDLEWFASFIGLNNLAEKHLDIVQSQMLSNPRSLHSLCKWLHSTPFIGPESLIPYDSENRENEEKVKKVQTQPAFFNAMETGAVSLLFRLCGGSRVNNLIDILCGDKHFDSMIARFVVFMNSATSTPKLTRLGLAILHTLSRDPRTIAALRGNTSSVKNLQKLIPSIADPQKTQAQEILAKVEEGAKPKKMCASCGASGITLSKCSGCNKVRYCNRDHQKQHWKTHKPDCKP